MHTYLFVLGRETHLCAAEISAVFSQSRIEAKTHILDNKYLVAKTSNRLGVHSLMEQLGGTVKIAEKINTSIKEHIEKTQPDGKIHFSLSGPNAKKRALALKKELKSDGRSVRYIEANNTATILHNNLVKREGDFTVAGDNVFVTVAIQPIEAFGKRDFEKPGADSRSGMLPPKLARMMINLTETPNDATLFDPFCGSGTLLMEALTMGYKHIVGIDLSEKAIADTGKNIHWIGEEFGLQVSGSRVFVSDVRAVSHKKIPKHSIDAIATEPYMGTPKIGRETKGQLAEEVRELADLYTNAFKTFSRVVKPGGTIIFIIPKFRHDNAWIEINCLNDIKKLGFDVVPFSEKYPSLLYWRRRQHVGREIWKFRKK